MKPPAVTGGFVVFGGLVQLELTIRSPLAPLKKGGKDACKPGIDFDGVIPARFESVLNYPNTIGFDVFNA
jgi:hypothetical protein